MKRLFLLLLLPALLLTASCQKAYTVKDDQVTIPCKDYQLRLQVVAPEIIRVSAVPEGPFADRQSLAVVPQPGCRDFEVTEAGGKVRLATDSVVVEVYKASGTINFYQADGTPLLQEGVLSFEPVEVEGKKGWSVRTWFAAEAD